MDKQTENDEITSGIKPGESMHTAGHAKMVVLKFHLDGRCTVTNVEGDSGLEPIASIKNGRTVSKKEYESVPKRLSFFLEKGFKLS